MSRIFIVGSGPSLKDTPMRLLKNEDLFVMNKFGRMDSYFGWNLHPKMYMKLDFNPFDDWEEEINWGKDHCDKLYLWDRFATGYKYKHANYEDMPEGIGFLPGYNVQWIKKCPHTDYMWDNWKAVQSWHLPELCTAFGGMSTMLQIASMEYDEIYLVGCDLGYAEDQSKNHALPDYTVKGAGEAGPGNMLALHNMARRSSPVPIYNATIGGQLEVYPRVKLEDVLG